VTTWGPSELRRPSFFLPLLVGALGAAGSGGSEPRGYDLQLERAVAGAPESGGRGATRAFSTLGEASTGALLVGSAYVIGRLGGNERLQRVSSLSTEALINAGLWSTALKSLTSRARPTPAGTGGEFFSSDSTLERNSFPSGHAMGAFAMAAVVADEYRDKRWVPWVAYGTAGLIGVSRIRLGRHFPSDVLVGGLLGSSIGRMVSARQGERREWLLDGLTPIVDPVEKRYGLMYSHSW
jgi:hypothetical protein